MDRTATILSGEKSSLSDIYSCLYYYHYFYCHQYYYYYLHNHHHHHDLQPPTAPNADVAMYFRLRFEKAEQRYDRMKGLTRAALEKVRCIERENKDLRTSKELVGLKLDPLYCDVLLSKFVGRINNSSSSSSSSVGPSPGLSSSSSIASPTPSDEVLKLSIEHMVSELGRVSAVNARLMNNNQLLRNHVRGGGTTTTTTTGGGADDNNNVVVVPAATVLLLPPMRDMKEDPCIKALLSDYVSEASNFKPLIAKLQAQITAMEYDWTQAKNMRDELFDYDDKLREHEMVADALFLKRKPPSSTSTTTGGAKLFATSHRHMIEILVEDRNRNINGYYARWVLPLEELRVKKDAEILELRMIIRQYEIMSGLTTVELGKEKEEDDEMDLPVLESAVISAKAHLDSLKQACAEYEKRILFLNQSVKHYEDHANEWKIAHSNAVEVINKAEKLRSDYNGKMDALHQEGQRIAAKKKELEKSISAMLDAEGRFSRLRDISDEMEEAEGEIAAKECALKRLKDSIVRSNKVFDAEQRALSLLEIKLAEISCKRAEQQQQHLAYFSQMQQQQQQQQHDSSSSATLNDDHVMVDEALSASLSHVFV